MSALTDVAFTAPVEGLPVAEIDPVTAATLKIYETRGWTRTDKMGQVVPDDLAAKTFVYELFRDSGVVNSEADILEDGLSAADLFAKTFPSAQVVTSDSVEPAEFEAYKAVMRKLWQWAGTSIRSHCQETAEMQGFDYVMCEKKVFRASRDSSTGTGAMQSLSVRFFTSDPDLIFELSSQPAAAKLVKAAEETAKHLQMNTSRHPELTTRVAKETQSALKRSAAHLAPVTAAKSGGVALTAGADVDE